MSFQLTRRVIKQLCGRFSYERGEAYCRAGKVAFTNCDPEASFYEAEVHGNDTYRVTARFDRNGNTSAVCTCPALHSYDKYCSHIAAVLLSIQDIPQDGMSSFRSNAFRQPEGGYSGETGISAEDMGLMSGMLGLFGHKALRPSGTRLPFDTREILDIEVICKPVPYGRRMHMFGIELKAGFKRLYIVQNIRDFLDHVDRREVYASSRHVSYDPELHSFRPEHDAVLRKLIQIHHNEKIYREAASKRDPVVPSGERMLPVPPLFWESLLPLLAAAPSVKLVLGDSTFDGMRVSDEPVPLRFEFDEAQDGGYEMAVLGMERITVMEAYVAVLADGKLLKLQADPCRRLAELQRMLEASGKSRIRIAPEQMEAFLEKVVPGLMKLGSVGIARAVSDRIVRTPLKARLYLDRVKDRLLAGLEFQYGDLVINPSEASSRKRGEDRILLREGEREERILELMEQSSFARTESGYFLDDEEAEYDFLYRVLPQLEELVEVYATSAVKVRLFAGHAPPKVTVDVDERTDWLEFRFDMAGIPESDIRNVLKSLEEKRKYYRLPSGALLPLDSAAFQEIVRFMNEIGIRSGDLNGTEFRLPVVHGLHLTEPSPEEGSAVRLGKSLRRLLDDMRNPDRPDFCVPVSLASVLRDYQKHGFGWLKMLAHYRFGGILADDMGLGKTLQSIAFLVSVLPEIRSRELPALVVCPASLTYNWRNELKKFAPEIRTVIADGNKQERIGALKHGSRTDVIITSYPLLRRDIGLYAGQAFHTLILDEAQAFKNYATQTAQAVKAIRARHRFALTGTPVENSLEELWSIFDAVLPELFPDRKAFAELSRETVAKRVRPFLLRRLKSDVLKELPEKIESLQASELLPEQKKLYAAYLAKLRHETLKHLHEEGYHKSRIKILAGLTRLRQLCCHPALFVEGYGGSSAKFEQLMQIVEECRSAGKRMLVFSQFTEMLGLIRRELGYRGVPHFYLDGQTPASERAELCSRFNEGERELFLISLKAGGTGLNLTGADTVILYDLWWNPAVERQAEDRAHRIGQKNVVQVIRLVAQGTVEDKMYELQQRKKSLIEEVLRPGEEELSALTEQEIRDLLTI